MTVEDCSLEMLEEKEEEEEDEYEEEEIEEEEEDEDVSDPGVPGDHMSDELFGIEWSICGFDGGEAIIMNDSVRPNSGDNVLFLLSWTSLDEGEV